MDTDGLCQPAGRDRARKRAGRRPRGVEPRERDGYWHAVGTLRVGGRSIRVRKGLGVAVAAVSYEEAETECQAYVDDLKAIASGKIRRGDPVAVAVASYIGRARKRPLGASTLRLAKEIAARFRLRRLNEIPPTEWNVWIDGEHTSTGFTPGRMTGRSASSRERLLNGVFAFLNYAKRQHGLAVLPVFERDNAARNPNRRARRRVHELRPQLVQLLFDAAHIAIRAQLAVERCTGARVSSVIYAARVCDLVLAGPSSKITFPETKNGEDVVAALDGTAVAVLKDYLKWRGRLHDREAPLFLTPDGKPYTFNGRDGGGQNKTGFNGAKRRAIKALRDSAEAEERRLRAAGRRKAADDLRDRAAADAALLGKVTQHWFRHRLATLLVRQDPRGAMEQGGWLDVRSVMGYAHDVPEHRARLVAEMDDLRFGRKS